MHTAKRAAFDFVERNGKPFAELSDAIFHFAELGMQEYRSAELMCGILADSGFAVERNPAGFETGFVATYGHGAPVIAIHTEYDANPTNSQVSGVAEKKEIVPGAPGHCEGHNVNAAVMITAALAVADALRAGKLGGTIKVVGAPAEEQLISRPYLVQAGYFDDVDVALHPHILDRFEAEHGLIQYAAISADFAFSGEPAHAAIAPWDGRDALDAVVLMDVGMAHYREHMPRASSVHRVFTEGGVQPNVIPAETNAWWYFRGPTAADVTPVFERAKKIAEGACLMADCTFETRIRSAVWPVLLDRSIARQIAENIALVGMPAWTAQEQDFARSLQRAAGKAETGLREAATAFTETPATPIAASNDAGDVSWKVPMGRLWFPANVPHLPFHHWAAGAALATSIAHKGGLAGAKALAGTIIDYFCDTTLVDKAKASFEEATGGVRYRPLAELGQPPHTLNRTIMEQYRARMEPHYTQITSRFA